MADTDSRPAGFLHELRRRRVLTTAGLYVVGAWLVIQAADVFFPGWDIPDSGINVLLVAAILGFPLALVFGWFFNITGRGIMRTTRAGPDGARELRPLQGNDYLVLTVLVLISGIILSYATVEVLTLREVAPAPAADKPPNSIAVLPFENISTDPGNAVFSDGVSEEIRNRLGKYAELQVIARASSSQFKGSEYAIPSISDLLGVRYLLQGSVRRQGDRIRISAHLVTDKGAQLWSRSYDRILDDIFDIQDDIADLVATEVTPQIVASYEGSYKPALDAYEHYLAGRDFLYRRDRLSAEKEFRMAIALDPDYAQAHAEYAISLLFGYPEEQQLQKADAAIATALSLVPELPRALAARGLFFSAQSPPDPAASEAALREALTRNPNMVDAMNWLAGTLSQQGRDVEAEQWWDKAYKLDPFNSAIVSNLANRYWEEGNPERAEAMLLRLVNLPQPPLQATHVLVTLYSDTGRLVEANRIAKRLLLAGGWQNYFLALNYAILGQFQHADYWMSGVVRDHPDVMWVRIGWVQAQTPYWEGNYARAASEMRQARDSNGVLLEQIDPNLRFFYGITQALAGDFAGAVDSLTETLPESWELPSTPAYYELDAYQALAWSYKQSGMPDKARQLLEIVEQWFVQYRSSVNLIKSPILYQVARNAVMMGDTELALNRLEQAVAAGWREYYINTHDPRWGVLRDDPRYRTLMADVKADVDRQRAEVERIDAEEDFPALLEEVRERQRQSGH